MKKRSYAIIGAGAIGGYCGACLQKAGFEVHFLLRSDYDHVYAHGLTVQSVNGNFSLPRVQAYEDPRVMPPCDVVCVALKTTQNHLLPGILEYVLKEDGIVLLMQNGLGAEEGLAEYVAPNQILGGLWFICAQKPGPGHIAHLNYGQLKLARFAPNAGTVPVDDELINLAAVFESAGIPTTPLADLVLARWQKLVWNIPFNGLCILFHAATDVIMQHPQAARLAHDLMVEVCHGARAFGRNLPDSLVEDMLELTRSMPAYQPSMKVDYDLHRELELDTIFANPLQAARSRGVAMPRVEMLYRQLRFLVSPSP